jgi:hypothetical protein
MVGPVSPALCRMEEPDFQEAFLRLASLYTSRRDEPRMEKQFTCGGNAVEKKRPREEVGSLSPYAAADQSESRLQEARR